MAKWKVVITDCYYESLAQEYEILGKADCEVFYYDLKTEDEVIEKAKDCDALICQFAPITRRVLENLPKCKIVVRYAIGFDNIDTIAAEELGIHVCNIPDYCVDEVSNQTITLLLDCVKKLTFSATQTKLGNKSYLALKPLYRMAGKTLGIIGFGRIGREVAKKMSGFSLNIISYDPYMNEEAAKALNVKSVGFEELIKESDYIVVQTLLNSDTYHMINKEVFEMMKPTAIFVNTSRGGIVDEKALVWALENHAIYMAGIDVLETEDFNPNHPIFKLDNAVVTPHMAWYSEEAGLTLQRMVAEEVARKLKGEPLRSPVNNPKNPR